MDFPTYTTDKNQPIFLIFMVAFLILYFFDYTKNYRDFPISIRQALYASLLGFAVKWGYDLVSSQDWASALFLLVLFVLVFLVFNATIKRGQEPIDRERGFTIKSLDYLNSSMEQLTNTVNQLSSKIDQLTVEIRADREARNGQKDNKTNGNPDNGQKGKS